MRLAPLPSLLKHMSEEAAIKTASASSIDAGPSYSQKLGYFARPSRKGKERAAETASSSSDAVDQRRKPQSNPVEGKAKEAKGDSIIL